RPAGGSDLRAAGQGAPYGPRGSRVAAAAGHRLLELQPLRGHRWDGPEWGAPRGPGVRAPPSDLERVRFLLHGRRALLRARPRVRPRREAALGRPRPAAPAGRRLVSPRPLLRGRTGPAGPGP